MKKLSVLFVILGMTTVNLSAQDLEIGNVSIGYEGYDEDEGLITGIYFDVLCNEEEITEEFEISIFLVDPDDIDINYQIWSYIDEDGQGESTLVEYDGIDIDIDDIPDVPDGDYRLIVCVDDYDDISESDETNNCVYASLPGEDLTYSADGGSSGIDEVEKTELSVYPNPTTGFVYFSFEEAFVGQINFYDLTGKKIQNIGLNGLSSKIDLAEFQTGIYLYEIVNMEGEIVSNGKISKTE